MSDIKEVYEALSSIKHSPIGSRGLKEESKSSNYQKKISEFNSGQEKQPVESYFRSNNSPLNIRGPHVEEAAPQNLNT